MIHETLELAALGRRQGTPRCFYHPNQETEVTCGRCGRPLCADCVRHGATGVRCAECLRLPRRARGLATREQILRAAGLALLVALAGGLLLGWLGRPNFLAALALGFAVGSAAFVGSRRHRDATIQGIAGATALVGILVAAVVISLAAPHRSAAQAILAISYDDFILPALAAMAGAIARFFL